MNLEKIGLLFLLNYFNQLSDVKNHLLMAAKEVLLALQTSIDMVSHTTSKSVLANQFELVAPIFKQAQSVLHYTIQRITPSQLSSSGGMSLEGLKLKEHIVNSIVSAIDDEIEAIRDTHTEKAKLKIEALRTVKQVLQNQKDVSLTVESTIESSKAVNVA